MEEYLEGFIPTFLEVFSKVERYFQLWHRNYEFARKENTPYILYKKIRR